MKQLNKYIYSFHNSLSVMATMKKQLNRLASLALVFTLLFTLVIPVAGATEGTANVRAKDEVVYGTLKANGTSESGYVVNVFEVTQAGEIVDYGNYSAVKNLTNLSEVVNGADQVKFTVEEGKFYYQGDLALVELPWDFTVTYYLDGRKIVVDELLGADGRVEIKIETKANSGVDPVFFNHYTLQVSLPFEVEKFSNIKAADATIANAGKMEQVTFTVLPEEEAELTVTADVADFEFAGIDIVAIPFAMALDDFETDDMVDDFGELSDAIAELHDGVGKLNEGIRDLRDGTGNLQDGSAKFQQGLVDLNGASGSLVNGSTEIKRALGTMKDELSFLEQIDLSQFNQLTNGLTDMEKGLREIAKGLDELADGYAMGYAGLQEAIGAIPDYDESLELSREDQGKMISAGISKEKVKYLMENLYAAQAIKQIYSDKQFQALFNSIEPILHESSGGLLEIANGLKEMNSELKKSLNEFAELERLSELVDGINEFATQYNSFHQGLVDYTNGVGQLTDAYSELHSGIGELSSGTDELSSGTSELYDGTGELSEETATLPEDVQAEIDEFMESYDHSDFEAKSFVSEKNDHIGLVQFILTTEEIAHPEIEEEEEKEKEKKGFWEMVKGLFRKN